MSQNQEIIESKLCAYIDGELDPEGRAEIEKHLEANPQHRRLLESLKATRDLIRWLPREPAPPELAETLNGQLERSVLLDYDGESLRPSIFPRIFAAAAIIVLTAGLAAAVYFALPKSHRNAQIAVNGPSEQPKQTEPTGAPTDALAHADDRDKEGAYFAKGGFAGKGGAQVAENLEKSKDQSEAELDQIAQEVAANTDTIVAAANGSSVTQNPVPPINNAVVMLVRSNQPEAAEKELANYLTSNQIQWRAADLSQRQELGTNLQDRAVAMRSSGRSDIPAVQQPQQRESVAQQEKQFAGSYSAKPSSTESLNSRLAPGAAAAQSPATQPNEPLAQMQQGSNPAQLQAGRGAQQTFEQRGFANASLANNPRPNNLYVARMSRSQAQALSTTMNRQGAQAAEVKDFSARGGQDMAVAGGFGGPASAPAATQPVLRERNSLAIDAHPERRNMARDISADIQSRSTRGATTQPAGGVIQVGDELRVVSDDLKKAASSEPAQTVRVAADGTVNLPSIGVFPCAGLTVDQANKAISEVATAKYSAKNGANVSEPGLKIERLASVDSKRAPAPNEASSALTENTQPAAATTQPSLQAESSDEAVNVVIVVEPSTETPASTTGPATQPAGNPEPPPAPSQPTTQTAPTGQP